MSSFIEKFSIVVVIFLAFLVVLAFIGWTRNVVKFVKLDFQEPYKAEVIRTISLVPPIGAITGWINIKDQ